ncbi:MAG: RimK/LysX family protein [Candidatus Aenigmatarchaeota archaeon]
MVHGAPGKRIAGLVEKVSVTGEKGTATIRALFDTGAKSTSIDKAVANRIGLGSPIRHTMIYSASNSQGVKRPVVRALLEILDEKFDTEVNIQDRSHMTFKMIIGRNILSGNFIVDPEKHKEMVGPKE